MAEVSFYDPKQEADIKRRRALAANLMKAGEQPTSTEMVGGMAVRQSPLLALTKAMTQGIAGYQSGQADQAQTEMDKQRQDRMAEAIRTGQLGSMAQGSPEEQQLALKQKLDQTDAAQKFAQQKSLEQMKIDAAKSGGGGGATGELVRDYMKATGVPFHQALYAVQTGMRQGQRFDSNGNIVPMTGVPEAKGAIKGGETQGVKDVELKMNPAIAAAEEAAKLSAKTAISDIKAMPELDRLSELNKSTVDLPFAGTLNPALKMAGIVSPSAAIKSDTMDLMQQARKEIASPLAKELGVNPTDKDFQASLERIFDPNSSKAARQAQIDIVRSRIMARKSNSTKPPEDPLGIR